MELLVVPVVVLAAGFWLSLHLDPYTQCEACRGQGKHRGGVFGYAHWPCHKCSGTGRKQRSGAAGLGLANLAKAQPVVLTL